MVMPSMAPRGDPAPEMLPLIAPGEARRTVAIRRGEPVTAAQFLGDVERIAQALPDASHVLNVCTDRYRFAVVLCAAIVRRQVALLPPATTANVIASLRAYAPSAYYVSDEAATGLELPRCELPALECRAGARYEIPRIAADQLVACVFTSGTTGEPLPNLKTWGSLVHDVRGEARRLEIGEGHAIVGTVPPQHMYGFESTVLLPLVSGAALTPERPYFPAEINAALARLAPPRTLFITPFHLRAWLEAGETARVETIVSATAPLSPALAREAERRTGARLIEIYGCTESGQIATRRTAKSAQWEALDGLKLWNDGAQTLVAGGHVERPTPLQDVIEVLGDGTRFLLHGRAADMVNVAGKRNSLGYLTHQLVSIAGVQDGVFYLPDDRQADGVTRVMAFAVAPGMDAKAIIAELRSRIDPAFLPRPLVLVERLPREPTGKLTRASLEALARSTGQRASPASSGDSPPEP